MRISDKQIICKIIMVVAVVAMAVTIIPSCTTGDQALKEVTTAPLSFSIAHVSDTHTYVTPYEYMLKINGRDTIALMGGYSLLMSAVDSLRKEDKGVLLLHAGDILEGTMWTPLFGGRADCDCLNTMKFDALVPGNHDFSRGNTEAAAMFSRLKFPVVVANLDVSAEPLLAGKVVPYTVCEIMGQKVGIIGLITPNTAWMNQPGGNIVFHNPVETARHYIAILNEKGINKIIVLSHLGYDEDVRLARAVNGIDVIIGGHSHTFMGGPEFEAIGLHPQMPYPMEVAGPAGDKVLIAHSWEYNRLLGLLKVNFTDKGKIISYSGLPQLYATDRFKLEESWGWGYLCSCRAEYGQIMQVARNNAGYKIYYEQPEINGVLQTYFSNLPNDADTMLAVADENLYRGLNRGPGPVIADAFLTAAQKLRPAVQFSVYASYSIRNDIYKGDISQEKINMLVPLRQNLTTVTASGSLVKQLIEMVYDGHIKAGVPPPYLETSGLHITVDLSCKSGERVTALQVRDKTGSYKDIQPDMEYTFVTTDLQVESAAREVAMRLPLPAIARERAVGWLLSYLKFNSLEVKDVDALTDYCRAQKNLKNNTEARTTLIAPASGPK